MKLKVYTLFDSKVEIYMKPFYLKNKGEALRAFTDIANDKDTNVGKYPEDFTLFEIGEYDEETGHHQSYEAKKPLGTALEYKKQQAERN